MPHKANQTSFKKGHPFIKGGEKGWFKKGNKSWTTGTKGLVKANKGSFKKGQKAWNRGLKRHWNSPTEFKKGNISWNNNLKIWKGTIAEYRKIHRLIRKKLGKPQICSICKKIDNLVWANKSQKYLKSPSDWESLCRSCHTKKDSLFIKLKLKNNI